MGSSGEEELKKWIRRSKAYYYIKNGEETVLETKDDELIFTFQNVGAIYDRLIRHLPKSDTSTDDYYDFLERFSAMRR